MTPSETGDRKSPFHLQLMFVGHCVFEIVLPTPLERKCPLENATTMEMSDRVLKISRPTHPLHPQKTSARILIVNDPLLRSTPSSSLATAPI